MAKTQRRCGSCQRFMRKMGGIAFYFNPLCTACVVAQQEKWDAFPGGPKYRP